MRTITALRYFAVGGAAVAIHFPCHAKERHQKSRGCSPPRNRSACGYHRARSITRRARRFGARWLLQTLRVFAMTTLGDELLVELCSTDSGQACGGFAALLQ